MRIEEIYKNWGQCARCPLFQFRRSTVIGRGSLPCHLFMIGEAPGKSEDLVGVPFIGPSGSLQAKAQLKALKELRIPSDLEPLEYITNVLACRPTDSKGGQNREPKPEEALACLPRVKALYALAQPRLVLLVGEVAKHHFQSVFPEAWSIVHPAYLIRQGGESSPMWRNYVRRWVEIYSYLIKGEK